MITAQGSLTVIDMDQVYWNGKLVAGLVSIFLHSEAKMVKIEVENGDEAVLADMEDNGIKVRRLK